MDHRTCYTKLGLALPGTKSYADLCVIFQFYNRVHDIFNKVSIKGSVSSLISTLFSMLRNELLQRLQNYKSFPITGP